MKKLFFAAAMMLFTTAASAQTITNESVMKTYLDAVQTENADYAYNADIENGILTTQYIYRKSQSHRGKNACTMLTPHVKHCYSYDAEGRLANRTTYFWNTTAGDWQTTYRLDYSYQPGLSIVECSKWNAAANRFASPSDRMVYEVTPGTDSGFVSSYHRKAGRSSFQLTETLAIPSQYFYGQTLDMVQGNDFVSQQ
jgi:hypothetical protein